VQAGREWKHELRVRLLRADELRGSAQRWKNETNLFAPAARQYCNDGFLWIQHMSPAEVVFRPGRLHHVDKRVSDKFHIDISSFVDLLLERKNHQHLVDELANLMHTAFAPAPNLGIDEKNEGNAAGLQPFCETKFKIGKIDEYGGIGRFSFGPIRQ